VPPTELGSFFRQMASLIHAGFTVGSALTDLGMRTANSGLRSAAKAMGAATLNGASVAGQMVLYPGLFPEHVVGLVHAGETGGFVEFAFEEVALWAEQDAALRQGMWFPKVLIWNAVWTVLLMQPLVMIDSSKLASGDMRTMPHAFDGYGRLMPLVFGIGILLHVVCWVVGKMRHQPFAERFFDGLSLRLPVMARLAKMRALAAFTRVLRRLLMAGISPAPAFAAAANAVPNAVLRDRLRLGLPIVRGGQGLDAAIQATGMMEHDALQMLITGQKTGQWIEMLDRVTSYYQDEAARATEGAKAAQKRLGWILTIAVTGYVICFTTWLCYNIMFKVTGQYEAG
jgi:type II secretory pathway component PulF